YAASISVISKILILLTVCAALIRLRGRDDGKPTYFRLPYGRLLAVLGILASVWLLGSSEWVQLRDVAITTLIGVAFFALYRWGRRNSRSQEN
ncbi:MAG: hypothetical protein ACLFT3_16205, partial [Cyclobacteriaceae bacterium]